MKFDIGTKATGLLGDVLHNTLEPAPSAASATQRFGQWIRQGLAIVLSGLMIMIPMGQNSAFAQSAPPPGAEDSQAAPPALSADQLDQLVAPIALYPDPLVAQVLAAATYPTQVVEADRWRQAQGNANAEQIAAGADAQNWDPSVKALTAFPSVLAQMDKNIQWTTDLGNAYYNQPQDAMDSVQAMRQKAQAAGQLRNTPQQVVTNDGGAIAIAPANPAVVYVPVYDPWVVYGSPFPPYPGYYYYPPPGIFFGGLAIGFGIGIGIGIFSNWGWGWNRWGVGWGPRWGGRGVFYNHNTYMTRSTTVINRGYGRPGGPGRGVGARGAYARPGGGFNRGGSLNRSNAGNRGAYGNPGANRPGGNYGRPGGASDRSASRPAGNSNARPGGSYNRPSMGRAAGSASARPSSAGSRPSGGGGHQGGGGGHSSGGGGHQGGGHEGHR